ncbi:hypothetical protein ACWKW9_23080 [Rhizobium daejeonense]
MRSRMPGADMFWYRRSRQAIGLADYLAPALHTMLRRVFSLNLEARA